MQNNDVVPFSWRARLSLCLTIASILLWAASLIQAKLTIGFYGLISSYPATYFIALGLLTIASFMLWISKEKHGGLPCLQLCLLIVMLWLTPVLIGGNPISVKWSYSIYFPNTAYIVQNECLNPAQWTMQNWPGAFLIEAAVIQITGAGTVDFLALYSPILTQFLTLPPLYIFFKNTLSHPNHCWAACWLFFLANWTSQLYFCPQGIGLFLLITLLALLSSTAFWQHSATAIGYSVGTILVIAGLTVTHLLTSILASLNLIALWLCRHVKRAELMILSAILVVFWMLYGATTQLESNLPLYLERAFNLEMLFSLSGISSASKASPSFVAVTYATYLLTFLMGVASLGGFIVSRKFKDTSDRLALCLLVSPFIILLSMLYGSEFWARAYLFALVPIAYFIIRLLKTRVTSVVFLMLLIVLLPLHIITNYGASAIYYQPKGETACWQFEIQNTAGGNMIGGYGVSYPRYPYASLSKASWNDGSLIFDPIVPTLPQYVHIGVTDINSYEYTEDDASIVYQSKDRLEDSPNYSLIYANPDVALYIHQELK